MLGGAGRLLPTSPFGHHREQHGCQQQQAQQEHSAPDQQDAEGHRGVGELRPEPGRKLLTRNPGRWQKGAIPGEPWLGEEDLGDGRGRAAQAGQKRNTFSGYSGRRPMGIKESLLNWGGQGGLPDLLPDGKFPRGGRNREVSL